MQRTKCHSVRQSMVAPLILLCVLLFGITGCDSDTGGGQKSVNALERIRQTGVLRWGVDVIGGVPFAYEDPKNPDHYIGFEVDIANAIARHLGVRRQMVVAAWDKLIPELQRGTFDIAMNGIEDTESREHLVAFSVPYFAYSQRITVRLDNYDIRDIFSLAGKRVATLSGSAAEEILRGMPGVKVKIKPESIYAFRELEQGIVDAVVIDTAITAAHGENNPNLKVVGDPFGLGNYVIAFRHEDEALRLQINSILVKMKKNGELAEIYRKWNVMDDRQKAIGVVQ